MRHAAAEAFPAPGPDWRGAGSSSGAAMADIPPKRQSPGIKTSPERAARAGETGSMGRRPDGKKSREMERAFRAVFDLAPQTVKISGRRNRRKSTIMDRYQGLLDFIRRDRPGREPEPVMISGDASFRKYYRYDGRIYVDAPPETEKNAEFVRFSEIYNRSGVRVPKVYSCDLENGYLCVEDFGDRMFSACLDGLEMEGMYLKAADVLQRLAGIGGAFTPFDAEFVRREDKIFTDWYLDAHMGRKLSGSDEKVWNRAVELFAASCASQPQVTMHRDFHCRNIMVLDSGELGLVDFQDTVTGPLTYDLASLVRDCYITLPDELYQKLVERSYDGFVRSGILKDASAAEFELALDLVATQRHLKAIGIFCRLLHRDGRNGYLQYLPRVFGYVRAACGKHRQLEDLGILLEEKLL